MSRTAMTILREIATAKAANIPNDIKADILEDLQDELTQITAERRAEKARQTSQGQLDLRTGAETGQPAPKGRK